MAKQKKQVKQKNLKNRDMEWYTPSQETVNTLAFLEKKLESMIPEEGLAYLSNKEVEKTYKPSKETLDKLDFINKMTPEEITDSFSRKKKD